MPGKRLGEGEKLRLGQERAAGETARRVGAARDLLGALPEIGDNE